MIRNGPSNAMLTLIIAFSVIVSMSSQEMPCAIPPCPSVTTITIIDDSRIVASEASVMRFLALVPTPIMFHEIDARLKSTDKPEIQRLIDIVNSKIKPTTKPTARRRV